MCYLTAVERSLCACLRARLMMPEKAIFPMCFSVWSLYANFAKRAVLVRCCRGLIMDVFHDFCGLWLFVWVYGWYSTSELKRRHLWQGRTLQNIPPAVKFSVREIVNFPFSLVRFPPVNWSQRQSRNRICLNRPGYGSYPQKNPWIIRYLFCILTYSWWPVILWLARMPLVSVSICRRLCSCV